MSLKKLKFYMSNIFIPAVTPLAVKFYIKPLLKIYNVAVCVRVLYMYGFELMKGIEQAV